MKAMDDTRPNDFIEISGSKMRKLAAQGAKPCDISNGKEIPSGVWQKKSVIIFFFFFTLVFPVGHYNQKAVASF